MYRICMADITCSVFNKPAKFRFFEILEHLKDLFWYLWEKKYNFDHILSINILKSKVSFRSEISKAKQKSPMLCLSTDKSLSGDKGKLSKGGNFSAGYLWGQLIKHFRKFFSCTFLKRISDTFSKSDETSKRFSWRSFEKFW